MKNVLRFAGLELIYFVIGFGCMFLGFLSPFCWVYQPVIAAFLAAAPVLIVCKNWRKFGGLLILPGIYALLMILMGEINGTPRIIAIAAVLLAAEIIRFLLGYHSQKGVRFGYAAAALVPACSLLLLWLDKEFYYAGAVEEMGSVAYADGLMAIATPVGLIALIGCTILAGYIGAVVAEKLFKTRVSMESPSLSIVCSLS
ncbi:MAG: MptD family putative ECF transporter S component [Eubacteriales bacterium]|nr:MptD family putative ECF transporter S component [Eubacteriales bacterium]